MPKIRAVRRGRYGGISKRGGLNERIDLESTKALAGALADISRTDVSEIDGAEGRKGKGKSGRNDRLRSWIRAPVAEGDMEGDEMENAPNNNDIVVYQEFSHLVYDMWKEHPEIPSRLENAATNTFATAVAFQQKLLRNGRIPYYEEYMESHPNFAAGFRTAGGCLFARPVKILRAATTV